MKKVKFSSFSITLSACIAALVVFVILAVLSGAWPGSDFASQILAALAGAIVAAIITLFLLNSQTESEIKKQRDSKVFEEKLRIYENFYNELCKVVRDREITKEEEIDLQFQVANIAMHTTSEHIEHISKNVCEIIVGVKSKNKEQNFLANLFEINHAFREELYATAQLTEEEQQAEQNAKEAFSSITIEKEEISLFERIRTLKSKIDPCGSKQWIWHQTTLVHEFYTKIKNNKYVDGANIVLDLEPHSDSLQITIFSRTDENRTFVEKVAEELFGTNLPRKEGDNMRIIIASFDLRKDSDDAIAKTYADILPKVKAYRDKQFPL